MSLKQKIETILKIIIVFLGALLALSVFNGEITLLMIIGALGVTYIFVHYWQKRFVIAQQTEVQVK